MKTVIALVTALLAAAAIGGAATAAADPITCPAGQVSTKTATGWDCVNNGDNTSNAEDPKNPNADKGTF